ncbi:MAG TPA: hypothetical protein VE046_18055 [Steroidobacteraceae bacterium]|nr:hypothetical protein [Steroidobacteraceae bacterium]
MNVATPRLGIAALAFAAAAAIALVFAIPALFAGPKHSMPAIPAMPKARAEVSISQLPVGKDMPIAPAPASGKAIETVVVQSSR